MESLKHFQVHQYLPVNFQNGSAVMMILVLRRILLLQKQTLSMPISAMYWFVAVFRGPFSLQSY